MAENWAREIFLLLVGLGGGVVMARLERWAGIVIILAAVAWYFGWPWVESRWPWRIDVLRIVGGSLFLLFLALLIFVDLYPTDLVERKSTTGGAESLALNDQPSSAFSAEDQRGLRERLTGLAGPEANVHIVYWPSKEAAFAETLGSIFELAGWDLNFTNVAQATHNPSTNYLYGLTVQGFNRHLVDSVARLLEEAGISDVRVEMKELEFGRENPKWERAQARIYLQIGYQD